MKIYNKDRSDRFEFVFPYYDYNTNLFTDKNMESFTVTIRLLNTNNLKSTVLNKTNINDLIFSS